MKSVTMNIWPGHRDGSQLVFVDSSCDAGTCAYGQCSSLKSVAMSQSETNTLSVEKLIDCSPERLFAPRMAEQPGNRSH